MLFLSESDMMSKELQNSDLIYVNLMTDVFKIIVKYRRKVITKYRDLSPTGNRNFATIDTAIIRSSRSVLFCKKGVLSNSCKKTPKKDCGRDVFL